MTKESRDARQKVLYKERSERILGKKKQEKLNDDNQFTLTVSGTTMSIHPQTGKLRGAFIFLHGLVQVIWNSYLTEN